jgi:hypothetical protein
VVQALVSMVGDQAADAALVIKLAWLLLNDLKTITDPQQAG